jgi:hypothetical protein
MNVPIASHIASPWTGGEQQADENGNDRDYHQEVDQREAPAPAERSEQWQGKPSKNEGMMNPARPGPAGRAAGAREHSVSYCRLWPRRM